MLFGYILLTVVLLSAQETSAQSSGRIAARNLGQNPTVDSLENELHRHKLGDSTRLHLFLQLAYRINNSNPVRAEECARAAIDLSKRLGVRKEEARAYRYVGVSLQIRSFYWQAIAYYDTSRTIAESIGDSGAISAVWTNMGILYESQGDYPRALEYALRALRIDTEMQNVNYIANSLLNIGRLYVLQKEYGAALQYYERSKTLLDATKNVEIDHEILVEIEYGIGRVYKERKNFDQALKYFGVALKNAQKHGHERLRSDILHDIGSIYLSKGDLLLARKNLEEALQLQQQRYDKTGIATTLASLGMFYARSGNAIQAEERFMASLRIADEVGSLETQMNVCYHLAELCKQQGRFQQALEYRERELTHRDALFNAERSKNIGRLEMRYQLEQKDIENQLLMRDRALQEANQSRARLFLLALSAVLFLSVGIAFVFWQSRNAQRRVNSELQRHQVLVEEQAHKIEATNTELQERNSLLLDANEELQSAYTQIRRQSESLQEKNQALERLDNEKNELLAIVAHDLKNPIVAIRGLAELAQEEILNIRSAEETQIQEITAQMARAADYMLSLVKNILDTNRLESGVMPMNIVAFDIEPLVKSAISAFTEQATRKAIRLHFHSEISNVFVQADEQATMQVIENLISNAVKYSPLGKNVFVRIRSQSSFALGDWSGEGDNANLPITNTPLTKPSISNEQYLRIEITDEGPGISEDDMKKLFGKFARLSARPTGGEHSTGLGLSIVKKMVEKMCGKVWCESELGRGATFIVELPKATNRD